MMLESDDRSVLFGQRQDQRKERVEIVRLQVRLMLGRAVQRNRPRRVVAADRSCGRHGVRDVALWTVRV